MSARRGDSLPRLALTTALVAATLLGAVRAGAQGWITQLVISPQPSPFLSDWEIDPAIGELIVTNTTATTTDVTFHYTLTRGGQVLLRGTTAAHAIPAGESVVFNATSTFGGRADWDGSVQGQVARTGRLPEGEYEGCVTMVGPGNIVLAPRECARFSLQYPDPPFLVFPLNGDTVSAQDPIFEWQPVQLPPAADGRIGYVLQIAEVRTEARQLPEVALQSSILHYLEPDLIQTSHQYPVGAMPLVPGRTYAWRVQALDGEGRPVAANQGRSDIWTFVYRESGTEVTARVARVALESGRDTLKYAGDTTRYQARLYDADNVEIRGKRVAWSSLDTTVARVDTAGIVRGAGAGETRIVATVDGVADSALSVTAALAGLTVRFERYVAESDAPSLLELVRSGSFDEVSPRLMELLRSGELRIPLPRLPGIEAASSVPGGSGAWMGTDGAGSDGCLESAFEVLDPQADAARRVFVFHVRMDAARWQAVASCLGIPGEQDAAADGETPRRMILVASWLTPGFPRLFLAIKGPGLGLSILGPRNEGQFFVLNITPSVTVSSELLPTGLGDFFGDVALDAGIGLTYYSTRRCADETTAICSFLSWINPGNPVLTIQAFAGVTASESSIGTGSPVTDSVGTGRPGKSIALGFSIQASLPVRVWDVEVLGSSLDSTQVGFLFAVQDSIKPGDSQKAHNWSIGVSPTITAWITGAGGNGFELAGSIGFEIDPTALSDRPKLVVSGQLSTVWKFWQLRLGNPLIVLTRTMESGGDIGLGLSGTWGIGPWNGNAADAVGISDGGDAASSQRGDAGGAKIGGGAAFEEAGRGAIELKWEKPKPETAKPDRTESTYQERRSAHLAASLNANAAAKRVTEQRGKCDAATRAATQAENEMRDGTLDRAERDAAVAERSAACGAIAGLEAEAERAKAEEATAKRALLDAANARQAKIDPDSDPDAPPATPPATTAAPRLMCGKEPSAAGKRCFSWTARLAVKNETLPNLLGKAVQMIGTTP